MFKCAQGWTEFERFYLLKFISNMKIEFEITKDSLIFSEIINRDSSSSTSREVESVEQEYAPVWCCV